MSAIVSLMFTQPPIVKFRFREGAIHTMRFTWKAGGVPVDLTGWTARMEVRDETGTLVHALSTSPAGSEGSITLGNSTHNISIGPLPGPLVPGEYKQDLKLTSPGASEVGYFFVGSLIVDGRDDE